MLSFYLSLLSPCGSWTLFTQGWNNALLFLGAADAASTGCVQWSGRALSQLLSRVEPTQECVGLATQLARPGPDITSDQILELDFQISSESTLYPEFLKVVVSLSLLKILLSCSL